MQRALELLPGVASGQCLTAAKRQCKSSRTNEMLEMDDELLVVTR